MSQFEFEMGRLNDSQREAVEHMDGPLLVVAGPGTGKTQILSLRAATILKKRDVQPKNILCLTYTEAGATAMRKRLIELVGRDAYGIEVSTFHGFAASVKARFPQHFRRNPAACVVSELRKTEIINEFLKRLPFGSPLSGSFGGVASRIRDVLSFISKLKSNGVAPEVYRRIMEQNIAAADYLDANDELMSLLQSSVSTGYEKKKEVVDAFEREVHVARTTAPKNLVSPVVSTPGVYKPYLVWLDELVARTELMCGSKTSGYQSIRDAEFKEGRGKDACYGAKIRKVSEDALVAIDAYEHYQNMLAENDLFDFDDMVMDCVEAMYENDELRRQLQGQYHYIQVDEFQDTNGAQMRIVELLCEGTSLPNVMAVGDDDQAIMRFQGASVDYIRQFADRYQPYEVVLSMNYRSTPHIVELGSGISAQVGKRLVDNKQISAFRGAGSQTTFAETVFPSSELEYQALARDIRAHIDSGFIESSSDPDEAIAVISRGHSQIRALIPHLIAADVPFSYREKQNVFSLESLQTLLALMRFVACYSQGDAKRAACLLPQLVAAPELGGEHASSVKFAIKARYEFNKDWMAALEASGNPRLRGIYNDLMKWSAQAPVAPARELMYDMARRSLKYFEKARRDNPLAYVEFNSGIRAIMKFVEDEIGCAAQAGNVLRLPDIVDRLNHAERFGVSIDASVDLGTTGSVLLTTAHSSKGREFDLVYLLDADDATWHSSRRGSGLHTKNVLIGDIADEDDDRRLLFVAVTRAKDYLEFYRAQGSMLREFRGDEELGEPDAIESRVGAYDVTDLGEAICTSWRQSYTADNSELMTLLTQKLPPASLSASTLNSYVEYVATEDRDGLGTIEEVLLRLPDEPKIYFDFGHIAHEYMEQYVKRVLVAGDISAADELANDYAGAVVRMDYKEEDVSQYRDKFDLLAQTFGEWAKPRLRGRLETEVELHATVGDGVPLYGLCDLLIIDDARKEIRVVDYKSGKAPRKPEDIAHYYERQLQFYRLLVENSSEYADYRVIACENWHPIPVKGDPADIADPVTASIGDEEMKHLTALIDAVWHRLQNRDIDTSGFEKSTLYERVVDSKVAKKKLPKLLQRAYEDWLIAQDGHDSLTLES